MCNAHTVPVPLTQPLPKDISHDARHLQENDSNLWCLCVKGAHIVFIYRLKNYNMFYFTYLQMLYCNQKSFIFDVFAHVFTYKRKDELYIVDSGVTVTG